jgi:POT family proton-dependent oligopeptide transporter
MVESVDDGGLGFSDESATAIYGLYTAAVYMVMLPGGWIADRLLGAQKTVWYGAIVIMCGHFILAIPSFYTFFLGLLFIVVGTGLLKPNISAIVGELYLPNDPRRDAGFTIFYMGINLGGALGPLICSTLGESEKFGWHYGFAAAGVGMLFGLIQFYFSSARLGDAGLKPSLDPDDPDDQIKIRNGWRYVGAGFCIILILAGLMLGQVISVKPLQLAQNATFFIVALAGFYFFYIFMFGGLSLVERRRVYVIVILFFAAAIFWAGFEQAGSSLNLFAERYTDRMIGDFEVPAGWFQSLNPAFIIILAPVYSAVWIALARRHMDPSTPAKFALGLIILALGFAIMIGAAKLVVTGDKVLPTWLIFTYLFHTMGELALSPVGLSAMTKLAPRRYVGQMMGVFFLGASLGNVIAGLIAGEFRADTINEMPALYTQIVLTTAGCGLLLALFTKPIRKLMSGVE